MTTHIHIHLHKAVKDAGTPAKMSETARNLAMTRVMLAHVPQSNQARRKELETEITRLEEKVKQERTGDADNIESNIFKAQNAVAAQERLIIGLKDKPGTSPTYLASAEKQLVLLKRLLDDAKGRRAGKDALSVAEAERELKNELRLIEVFKKSGKPVPKEMLQRQKMFEEEVQKAKALQSE